MFCANVHCVSAARNRPTHATVEHALLRPAEPGYTAGEGKRGAMRAFAGFLAAVAVFTWIGAGIAAARSRPVIERSAAGTVIQPTRTIIRRADGSTRVIVIPRRRSYLDTGTEVSVGDRSFKDYMLPPGGDPGRPNWFMGPDTSGNGRYLPFPSPLYIPGFNPDTPF